MKGLADRQRKAVDCGEVVDGKDWKRSFGLMMFLV
jgi:hypothetical protein